MTGKALSKVTFSNIPTNDVIACFKVMPRAQVLLLLLLIVNYINIVVLLIILLIYTNWHVNLLFIRVIITALSRGLQGGGANSIWGSLPSCSRTSMARTPLGP